MATITGTLSISTPLAAKRIAIITATMGSASDQIVLTAASHGVRTIHAILGARITGGMDADFQTLQATFSTLTITIVAKQADGGAADEFTGTTIELALLVD